MRGCVKKSFKVSNVLRTVFGGFKLGINDRKIEIQRMKKKLIKLLTKNAICYRFADVFDMHGADFFDFF